MRNKSKALQIIGKPEFGYWQAFYRSFYSARVYLDAGKRWKGFGFLYLLFVFALMIFPFAMRITYEFKSQIQAQYLNPLKSLPLLFVHDGRLFFDKPMPYLIENDLKQVVGIVDTTGIISSKTAAFPHLIALLQEKQVTFWPPSPENFMSTLPLLNQLARQFGGGKAALDNLFQPFDKLSVPTQQQSVPYPIANEVYDVNALFKKTGLNKITNLFALLVYPSFVFFVFILSLFFVLTLAMMGQLLVRLFFSFKLKYLQASRILSVAMTPAIAILWFSLFLGYPFILMGPILLILTFFYFCFGALSLKRESKKLVIK